MSQKIALITGATGGIGKAAAIALARKDFTIIIHGRNESHTRQVCEEIKQLTGNNKIEFLIADMFLLDDIRRMAKEFKTKYDRLDILINNAGGIMNKGREVTGDGNEKTMALNLFAPFLLTALLLESIEKSDNGRIINVSSNSHQLNAKPDFDDLQLEKKYNPLIAYGNAKLFLIWITRHLAAKLAREGKSNITVNTLHPGAIATGFGVNSDLGAIFNFIGKLIRPFFKTAEQGAETIVYLATSIEVENISGQYFVNKVPAKVADKYYSPKREREIWYFCKTRTESPFKTQKGFYKSDVW